MATRTISTRLVLEGEAEYRAQLKNVNAELALQNPSWKSGESVPYQRQQHGGPDRQRECPSLRL